MFFDENNHTIDKKYYVDYLIEKYGRLGLTRQETADELGISLSFLDKLLREGVGLPNYRKIGKSGLIKKNSGWIILFSYS